MASTSLDDLNAKAVALKKEMAAYEMPRVTEAAELIKKLAESDEAKRLAEICAELPDSIMRGAFSNVGGALMNATQQSAMGLSSLQAVLNPPTAGVIAGLPGGAPYPIQ